MPNIRPNVIKDPPQSDGQTDLEEIFNLDISDRDFITYASNALTKAKAAWDSDFNLTENRAVSTKLWLGDHYEEYELYEHETPVVDNRIFISLESNLNYATGEIANPEVYPGGGEVNSKPSEASQIMAKDVRMALKAHAADDRDRSPKPVRWADRRCVRGSLGSPSHHDRGRSAAGWAARRAPVRDLVLDRLAVCDSDRHKGDQQVLLASPG